MRPTHKILARFKIHLTPHWKDICYELIDVCHVNAIKCSRDREEDKCFAVFEKWLELNSEVCYCAVFKALRVHNLECKIGELKHCIRDD